MKKRGQIHSKPLAIDLFSGCGGLSLGLRQAGFVVAAAIEIEKKAAATYALNHPNSILLQRDIREVVASELLKMLELEKGELGLLAGCPPCQGFSRLGTKNKRVCPEDQRNDLIFEFQRLVLDLLPRTVMLENVPALINDYRFSRFCNALTEAGYKLDFGVLDVAKFGVAQRRKRLILLGSRVGDVHLAKEAKQKKTVREVIGQLGAISKNDALQNLRRNHSKKIIDQMKLIPRDGGSRSDLPLTMTLKCHVRSNGFHDVYGRMRWDDVAPTITSGCTNVSKGRFTHPVENRAISLREASLLQGFPRTYKFDLAFGIEANSLMIGNALPPPFIKRHARELKEILSG